MSVQTKSNLPQDVPLRWNLRKAAVELSTTVDTLKKSLNQVSESPDRDGLYATTQLVKARYGELYQEKLRVQRETADRIALENRITRAEVVDKAELMKGLSALADAMIHIISTSGLSREAQEDLQRELASIPIILETASQRRTRLRRAKNGEAEKEQDES
jgi:hypothetical protein